MTRILLLFVGFYLLTGCNSNEDSSPYSEVLAQAPYSSLTDSIKKEPRRDDLYFRRAVLLNRNNFPEPALADFRTAWSIRQDESYAIAISNILVDKKPDEAVTFLKDALNSLPKSLFLRLSLARAYNELGKTDEALSVCNAILLEQPDQVNTLMLQTELFQKKGDSSAVLKNLEKSYSLAPLNLEVALKLAYQYAEAKNPKVIPLTDTLIMHDSLHLHADPFYVKGLYYSNTGDKEKAIQFFNETIKRDYNYLNAYIEKGKALLDQQKITAAYKTFGLANTIDPAFADAWFWMAKCQEQMDLKDEAKLNYEKAYSLDKTFTEAKEAADKIK
jgi:tetratricopeptide (TPR) repeat protein